MSKLTKRFFSMNILPRKFLPAPDAEPEPKRIEDTLAFLIKVCGVTNEQDAEIAIAAGANALGFNFDPRNPRSIDASRARQIVQAVRGDYLKVGVFFNPTEDELLETAGRIPLNVLQLHGDSAPFHLAKSLSVWQGIRSDAIPNSLSPDVTAWVLDTPSSSSQNGAGRERGFEWSQSAQFSGRAIVSGPLEASNVISAIEIARPWGVDACACLESKPGEKDPERLKDFVAAALAGFRLYPVEKPA
jgi:phosphoribosylanthranilate isomerase